MGRASLSLCRASFSAIFHVWNWSRPYSPIPVWHVTYDHATRMYTCLLHMCVRVSVHMPRSMIPHINTYVRVLHIHAFMCPCTRHVPYGMIYYPYTYIHVCCTYVCVCVHAHVHLALVPAPSSNQLRQAFGTQNLNSGSVHLAQT